MSLPRLTEIFESLLNTAKTKLKVEADLVVSDIEIGAVEIKDSTTDTRAVVGANGLAVDVKASTLPSGASTSALQTTGNTSVGNLDTNIGAKADAAATVADTTPFSVVAMLKGIWNKLGAVVLTTSSAIIGKVSIDQVTANANEVVIKSITAGDTNIGNVDIATLAKSSVATAHNNIADTTLSAAIDATGYSGIIVIVDAITGTWTIDLQCADATGGTYCNSYDGSSQNSTGQITATRIVLFRGITNFVKINATENVAGNVTVKYQLVN